MVYEVKFFWQVFFFIVIEDFSEDFEVQQIFFYEDLVVVYFFKIFILDQYLVVIFLVKVFCEMVKDFVVWVGKVYEKMIESLEELEVMVKKCFVLKEKLDFFFKILDDEFQVLFFLFNLFFIIVEEVEDGDGLGSICGFIGDCLVVLVCLVWLQIFWF